MASNSLLMSFSIFKVTLSVRFFLSLNRSACTLAKYFDEIEGANIETNTQMAREILEKTELDSDESIFSLDVKSLYTVDDVIYFVRKTLRQENTRVFWYSLEYSDTKSLCLMFVPVCGGPSEGI